MIPVAAQKSHGGGAIGYIGKYVQNQRVKALMVKDGAFQL